MESVREVRSPERAGQKTLDNMAWRVEKKMDQYAEIYRSGDPSSVVGRAIDRMDAKTLALDELNEYGTRITKNKKPLLSHERCSLTDLVSTLRARGYYDIGNPGTPVFRQTLGEEAETTGRS